MQNKPPRLPDANYDDLSPEAQDQAVADQIRYLAVSELQRGADLETLIAQVNQAASLIPDGTESSLASYLKAVAAVLGGNEPPDFPAAFRGQVEAVREAVRERGSK